MATQSDHDITQLLRAASSGDDAARDALLDRVYTELKALARRQLARERSDQTLDPTELVHDAWHRLVGVSGGDFEHRSHFFGSAALAMRRILVDRARSAARERRGGGVRPRTLGDVPDGAANQADEILALEELLPRLRAADPRKHDVVMLRYYAGLTIEQTANALKIAPATVKSDWTFARAWLRSRLSTADSS